jgi:hypothetical protein
MTSRFVDESNGSAARSARAEEEVEDAKKRAE